MASLLHRCHHCGYETDVSNTLAAFEDNPHCRQCGLSAGESDIKMQDDLINMMTRNLQLNPIQQRQDVSMPPTPQVIPQASPITYITQHYHHSAHQASLSDSGVANLLESAGVKASVLSPSQLQLFQNAQPDQQRRLIELWTVAPLTPENQMIAKNIGSWSHASLEQEEDAARHRWETQEIGTNPEPYISHGYGNLLDNNPSMQSIPSTNLPEMSSRKESNDPLHTSREWWHMSEDEPMEHQYGLLQQMMYTYPLDYSNRLKDDEEMS